MLERRLTILQAPAGFGKTTVLADVSRRPQQDGVVVGRLSLDEHDSPTALAGSIARALEHGGLDLAVMHELDSRFPFTSGPWMSMRAGALEHHAAPCLLVLDDADRLPPHGVDLVERLVKGGADNLHVAVTSQSRPMFDFATHVLDGSGRIVSTEQFRFSGPEIARFFGGELSHRQLAEVRRRTAGWPLGLMLCRRVGIGKAQRARVDAARLSSKYVEGHLLRNAPTAVRKDLLDLAVFDRIDAELVDEVLGSSDARLRVLKQPELDGFLLPCDKSGAVRRLHPLVKDYCVDRLAAEDPARITSLQAMIARARFRRSI